jgi:hypothetical protein
MVIIQERRRNDKLGTTNHPKSATNVTKHLTSANRNSCKNKPRESFIVARGKPAVDGFVTILKKKRGNPASSILSGLLNTSKGTRTPLFGIRSSSSLSIVQIFFRKRNVGKKKGI